MLCYKVKFKMTLSDGCLYLKCYIIKFIQLLLLKEKTQENKNILPPFLSNNKVVQVQEVTVAHIYIFMTSSIKMSIFTKKKTRVGQERFSLDNV